MLIPAAASASFLWSVIAEVLTNLATYSSPLTRVPVIVCVGSPNTPMEIGSCPF